jgi:hypothetical protein
MDVARMLTLVRRLGAVAILATGAIHLQQYIVEDFKGIPTIQILFLLNAVGSGVVGLCLLAPLERVLPGRWADATVALFAAVGLTIALGSLVGLIVSESGSLFGLRAVRYSTAAVLAIVAESAAVLLLTPVLASTAARALHGGETPPAAHSGRPSTV